MLSFLKRKTPRGISRRNENFPLPFGHSSRIEVILTEPLYITRYKSRDGRTIPNDGDAAWLKPAIAEMYRVLGQHEAVVEAFRRSSRRTNAIRR